MGYSDIESDDEPVTFHPPSASYPLTEVHKNRVCPPPRTLPTPAHKTEAATDKLAAQLFEAITAGIKSYNNKEEREGVVNGYFTLFRHGQHGKMKASELQESLSKKSFSGMLHLLNDYFNSSDAHYNNHSLATYLLDKLNDFVTSLDSNYQPETGSMAWASVLSHLELHSKSLGDDCLNTATQHSL